MYGRSPHKRTYFYENLEAEIQYFKPPKIRTSRRKTLEEVLISYITGSMSSEFIRTLKNS